MAADSSVATMDCGLDLSTNAASEFTEAADGFLFAVKDVVNVAYQSGLRHFRVTRSSPSIEIQIVAENDSPAKVTDFYRKSRNVRLFRVVVRVKGAGYDNGISWC